MLRKSIARLSSLPSEAKFNFQGNSSAFINGSGGIPFYGNVYAGRVQTQAWTPPPQHGSGLLLPHRNLWDDPAIQEKIKACPYFALCDQVLWQNMDPAYLDPGLLTVEEHQLMLLFSRAYFEKWRSIHSRPENAGPRLRILYGYNTLLREICELLEVSSKITSSLVREYLMDDAGLISMNPRCWHTAFLDPANRDQMSGRVLEYAGLTVDQRQKFYLLLRQMRRIRIRRKDLAQDGEDVPIEVIPFHEAPTLFDFSHRLNLEPYSGQMKAYDMIDEHGTPMVITLKDEDSFFDFLVTSFYKPNLQLAMLTEGLDDGTDCTTRYSLTVEKATAREAAIGQWF